MTAKKAHTDTIILLVVPLGFCTGTELLKTRPQSSQTAFPMVKEGPPGSGRGERTEGRRDFSRRRHSLCQWLHDVHMVGSCPLTLILLLLWQYDEVEGEERGGEGLWGGAVRSAQQAAIIPQLEDNGPTQPADYSTRRIKKTYVKNRGFLTLLTSKEAPKQTPSVLSPSAHLQKSRALWQTIWSK